MYLKDGNMIGLRHFLLSDRYYTLGILSLESNDQKRSTSTMLSYTGFKLMHCRIILFVCIKKVVQWMTERLYNKPLFFKM